MKAGPVDLSLWTHDDGYVEFFTDVAETFAPRSRFRWHLDVTKVGSTDLMTKMIAQAVSGYGTPDLAGLEFTNFGRMLRGRLADELLVDLTDTVAEVRDDLVHARTAPYSKEGKLYALDSDSPLVIYYYRVDEFARLGIPAEIETWEEFAKLGARLHGKHGVSFGTVTVGSELPQVTQSFASFVLQRGGRIFDENGKLDLLSAETEKALDFMVRGLHSGFLTTVSDAFGAAMQTALKTGKVIGLSMANWYKEYGLLPNVPEQAGQWRIRPLPRFRSGGVRTAFAGGTGFAALRDKPNTLAAVDLLKLAYLTPSQQIRRYRELGYLPTRRSVFDEPQLLTIEDDYCGGQRLFEVYRDIIDEAPPYYLSADQSILDTILSGYLLAAYKGDISPWEALRRTTEDFHGQTRN